MRQRLNLRRVCWGLALAIGSTMVTTAFAEEPHSSLLDRVKHLATPVDHHAPSVGVASDCPPRRHFAHFGPPTRSYSAFESPTSYGAHPNERCRPEVFSPRGIGVARRSGYERMDYSPYVLSTTASNHGPSYYTRHNLAPCHHPHCERGDCRH